MGAAVGNIYAMIGLLTNLANVNTNPTFNHGINNIINLTSTNNQYFSFGRNFGDTSWQNVLAYSQSYVSNQPFNFSYLIPNQTYLSLGMIIQNNTYTWSNQFNGLSDSLQVEVLTPQNANVIITIQQVLGTVNVSVVGTIDFNGLVSAGVFSFNPGGYLQGANPSKRLFIFPDNAQMQTFYVTSYPTQPFANTGNLLFADVQPSQQPYFLLIMVVLELAQMQQAVT